MSNWKNEISEALKRIEEKLSPAHRDQECEHCAGKGKITVVEEAPLVKAIREATSKHGTPKTNR